MMVQAYVERDRRVDPRVGQQLMAVVGVLLDQRVFFEVKGASAVEKLARHFRLADIMEQTGESDLARQMFLQS